MHLITYATMNGHFHIELENGVCINESNLAVAIAKAMARSSEPVNVGFVCSYGCGKLHALADVEMAQFHLSFPCFKTSTSD